MLHNLARSKNLFYVPFFVVFTIAESQGIAAIGAEFAGPITEYRLAFGQINALSCSDDSQAEQGLFSCPYTAVPFHQFWKVLKRNYDLTVMQQREKLRLQIEEYSAQGLELENRARASENSIQEAEDSFAKLSVRCAALEGIETEIREQVAYAKESYFADDREQYLKGLDDQILRAQAERGACPELNASEEQRISHLRMSLAITEEQRKVTEGQLLALAGESAFYLELAQEKDSQLTELVRQLEAGFSNTGESLDHVFWQKLVAESWQQSAANPVREQLALGGFFSCFVVGDSTDNFECWAYENAGIDIGDKTALLTSMAIGRDHYCFVLNGKVSCLGSNDYGQSKPPADVIEVTAVTAGRNHSCAIYGQERLLKCWGSNVYGESEVSVKSNDYGSFEHIDALALGEHHTCFLAQQRIHCFGRNDQGQSEAPAYEGVITSLTAGSDYSCALIDSEVHCWGREQSVHEFLSLYGEERFRKVVAHGSYQCGITTQSLVCAGYFVDGKRYTLPSLTHPRDVAIGYRHACALADEGLVCWGFNDNSPTKSRLTGPRRAEIIAWLKGGVRD